MSYESVPIVQYCSYSGCKHLSEVSFCQNCGSGWAKIIDLSETSPCTNRGESSQPTVSMQQPIQPALHVAALQQDTVNNWIMYIYGTYIPPFGGASLSLILFPSHQARNIITKPPVALPHNLSHISPIFSICAIPPSTAFTTPSTILQSLLLPSSNIALHKAFLV